MRNTPLKAFTKKGNSALKQVLKPEYTAPDLSFMNNQFVPITDSIKNTSLDSNDKIQSEIKDKIADRRSKIKPGYEHLYDDQGNFKEINPGEITNTKEERMIKAHRDANPLYNAVKGVKSVYDAFSG